MKVFIDRPDLTNQIFEPRKLDLIPLQRQTRPDTQPLHPAGDQKVTSIATRRSSGLVTPLQEPTSEKDTTIPDYLKFLDDLFKE